MWTDSVPPFDRVIADDSPGFLLLASYYAGRARYETGVQVPAIADFRRVLAADATHMYADNAQYYIGRIYYDMNDLPSATSELGFGEATYPDSDYLDSTRFYLGRSYYDRELYADAVAPFARLVEIAETTLRDDGLFFLGRSRYEVGQVADALSPMQEIETAYPDSSYGDNCLYWQARIYADLADCASANAAVDRLRTGFPTSSELPRAETYLKDHGC
jgi:TolA-binding protein